MNTACCRLPMLAAFFSLLLYPAELRSKLRRDSDPRPADEIIAVRDEKIQKKCAV